MAWSPNSKAFTPMIDTLRDLLFGTPTGHSAPVALAWCTAIGALGVFWSVKAFNPKRTEQPN